MKHSLSLTLIVKNEAHHLPVVLEYAHLFADEIIIVDTGSTDNTKEIARKYTDKIYDFPWKQDFAAARNFGIKKCTKDFILWLDADDYISKQDAKKLAKLLSKEIAWDVCYLPYHYTYGEYGESRLLLYRERIFRNRKGIQFQYPVHECLCLKPDISAVHHKTITIYHRTKKRWEDNVARNMALVQKALMTKKYRTNSRMWWLYGLEHAAIQKNTEAIKILLKSLVMLGKTSGREISERFLEIAVLYSREHDYEKAHEFCGKAVVAYNLWKEPFFESGRALWYMGRYQEALQMFLIASLVPRPTDISSIDLGLYDGPLLYDWLSLAYDRVDDFKNALRYVKKSLRYSPDNERFLEHKKYWEGKIKSL